MNRSEGISNPIRIKLSLVVQRAVVRSHHCGSESGHSRWDIMGLKARQVERESFSIAFGRIMVAGLTAEQNKSSSAKRVFNQLSLRGPQARSNLM